MAAFGGRLTYRNHGRSQKNVGAALEERELARRWRTKGDQRALQELVRRHMGLVVTIAREFRRIGHLSGDLLQEGYLGLLIAARRFDPDREACLATYATYWIRARMLELVVRFHGPVRIGTTRWQRRIFYGLARVRTVVERQGVRADISTLANALGVDEDKLEWMLARLSAHDMALDADGGLDRLAVPLASHELDPEEATAEGEEFDWMRERLLEAMERLDGRERYIVRARCLQERPATLAALGHRLGITRERVRQIESRAKTKLRKSCGP